MEKLLTTFEKGKIMKTIVVCGFSKSGKTTTCLSLIKELKKQNYSVTYAKDIHGTDLLFDEPDTDTDKALQAGADKVFGNNSKVSFSVAPKKRSLQETIKEANSDFLIIEGYKESAYEKIVCLENEADADKIKGNNILCYAGVLSKSGKKKVDNYKLIDAQSNPKEVVAMIKSREEKKGKEISLLINDKPIPMIDYVSKTLQDIILAYVKNLKKIDEIKTLTITIKNG